MNLFLKRGISIICNSDVEEQNSLHDEQDHSEQKAFVNDDTLNKWATKQGVMEVARDKEIRDEAQHDRWATKEGVIEIARKSPRKSTDPPKIWRTRERIIEVAEEKTRDNQLEQLLQARKHQFKAEAALNRKLRKFDAIQIAIANNSDIERAMTLWGTGIPISRPQATDIEDHRPISQLRVGVHPQGVIVNPFNSLVYIANQLSDSVTVVHADGVVTQNIQLPQSGYPGTFSPVHIAVHSRIESTGYGKVYVAGSVANSVAVVSKNFLVSKIISVGVRPIAIAFNPHNEKIYVANMVSKTISVIDTVTDEVVETLPVQEEPWQISVNPLNGDIYILYRAFGKVQILNADHLSVFESSSIQEPVSLAWHQGTNRMYVVSIAIEAIIPINAITYALEPSIPVGDRPYGIAIHPGNNFIYVANTGDETISILNPDHTIRGSIPASDINIGLAIHSNNVLFTSKTLSNLVEVIGYAEETNIIQTDHQEIASHLNYFRDNPAILQHIRFVVSSGNSSIRNLTITHTTISGRKTDTAISLSSYESPQHFAKVYEIDKVKGTKLDGNSRWRFTLPPFHSVALVIYYYPLEREMFFKNSLAGKSKVKICK